jgi:hypothetical protein
MTLLPQLRHRRWPGWASAAGRDLAPDGGEGESLPRIGLCRDGKMLGWDDMRGEFGRELLKAVRNLIEEPARWKVSERKGGFLGFGGQKKRLELRDDFAAERLFDGYLLADAHKLLKSQRVMIGAPVRGLLVAAPGDDAEAFVERVENAFLEPIGDEEPLTPTVLIVQDGQLAGVVGARPLLEPVAGFPWLPESEDPALVQLGYIPAERALEYSCRVDEDRRLPAAEMAALGAITKAKRTPEGRPVSTVRVFCIDLAVAMRAAAPLRAAGALVFYLDDTGDAIPY